MRSKYINNICYNKDPRGRSAFSKSSYMFITSMEKTEEHDIVQIKGIYLSGEKLDIFRPLNILYKNFKVLDDTPPQHLIKEFIIRMFEYEI